MSSPSIFGPIMAVMVNSCIISAGTKKCQNIDFFIIIIIIIIITIIIINIKFFSIAKSLFVVK